MVKIVFGNVHCIIKPNMSAFSLLFGNYFILRVLFAYPNILTQGHQMDLDKRTVGKGGSG